MHRPPDSSRFGPDLYLNANASLSWRLSLSHVALDLGQSALEKLFGILRYESLSSPGYCLSAARLTLH